MRKDVCRVPAGWGFGAITFCGLGTLACLRCVFCVSEQCKRSRVAALLSRDIQAVLQVMWKSIILLA